MNYDAALTELNLTHDTLTLRGLKQAYSKAAKLNRPEHAPQAFSKIRQAYDVLSSVLKDAEYAIVLMNPEEVRALDTNNLPSSEDWALRFAQIEGLQIDVAVLDPVLEEHRLDLFALGEAWSACLIALLQTHLLYLNLNLNINDSVNDSNIKNKDTVSNIALKQINTLQLEALNTLFQAKALDHYLSRQTIAEYLAHFLLNQDTDWVCLEALKLTLNRFDYELYGWYQHSWNLHSTLERRMDFLRERSIFLDNAHQSDTLEHYLVQPMTLLSFVKLWFIRRRKTPLIKKRFIAIQAQYPEWLSLMNAKQVHRFQFWPNTNIQILSSLLGLFSTVFTIPVFNFLTHTFIHDDSLKTTIDIISVLLSWGALSIVFIALWIKGSVYVKQYYEFLAEGINNNNNNTNNTPIPPIKSLTFSQSVFKYLNQRLTLHFFGRIEGVLICAVLLLWPFYTLGLLLNLHHTVYLSGTVIGVLLSFFYLKTLKKVKRIRPNHPILCLLAMLIGFYSLFLNKSASTNQWVAFVFIGTMVRSQFPSMIRVDWQTLTPKTVLFEHWQILESRWIKGLTLTSIAAVIGAIICSYAVKQIDASLYCPITTSVLALLLYIWLNVNADMDTPVMSIKAKALTFLSALFVLSLIYKLKTYGLTSLLTVMGLSITDTLLMTYLTMSIVWYYIYGKQQDYFERWDTKPKNLK